MENIKLYRRWSETREKALAESKRTKDIILAFSSGKTFLVYSPLSAVSCIREQNEAGALLIGRFKEGKEI